MNEPETFSTHGMQEIRVTRLEDIKAGDVVKRCSSMDAYAVDTDKPEQFRAGRGLIASRRVLITENDLTAWKIYRPK